MTGGCGVISDPMMIFAAGVPTGEYSDLVDGIRDAVGGFVGLFSEWWVLFLVAFAVLCVLPAGRWLMLVFGLFRTNWKWKRDPRREFTKSQKNRHYARIGDRCEWRVGGVSRCRHVGKLHADHWIPWAYGGGTSDGNLVGLCAEHNLKKSDKHPPVMMTFSIGFARLFYLGRVRFPGRSYKAVRRHR